MPDNGKPFRHAFQDHVRAASLDPASKSILECLARWTPDARTAYVWVTYPTICQETGWSRDVVKNRLGRLDATWFTRMRGGPRGGWTYNLQVPVENVLIDLDRVPTAPSEGAHSTLNRVPTAPPISPRSPEREIAAARSIREGSSRAIQLPLGRRGSAIQVEDGDGPGDSQARHERASAGGHA